jgi:hypothetical protein
MLPSWAWTRTSSRIGALIDGTTLGFGPWQHLTARGDDVAGAVEIDDGLTGQHRDAAVHLLEAHRPAAPITGLTPDRP